MSVKLAAWQLLGCLASGEKLRKEVTVQNALLPIWVRARNSRPQLLTREGKLGREFSCMLRNLSEFHVIARSEEGMSEGGRRSELVGLL